MTRIANARRHALLDLDGTLIDPKAGIIGSVRYALDKLGAPVPEIHELTWCIGPPLRQSFAKLLASEASVEQAIALYRENYRNGAMYEAAVYDGVSRMLDDLHAAGLRLLIVTSKPKVFAEPIARHFGFMRHVEAVHGPGLDGTHDDKTELLAAVLEREKIAGRQAVMIGDRKFDCLAANANGLPLLGALWGYGTAEELTEAGAAELCAAPAEVAPRVRRLLV
ncbi:MAG: HAD hydrolase-like protein [Hyphomicrobiaceae bacterium]|nr:MAG: HAD hydrolase-like protein [Hyphomicrobiaceae bacterium]